MRIISTNISQPTTIFWNGQEEKTGIFKNPVDTPLFLEKTKVTHDTIIDRVHHGGEHKACYIFSEEEYGFWKKQYPDLSWNWGMFGENLTVTGLKESQIRVGNIYRIGTALVQVSQPREPCYKLGIRFNDQGILKKFIDRSRPGTYLRILKEGEVSKNDELILIEESENDLTIGQFYNLLYQRPRPKELLQKFMDNKSVPQYKKDRFQKYL